MTDLADDAARTLRGEACSTCQHRCPVYDGGADRTYLSCGIRQEEVSPNAWCEKFAVFDVRAWAARQRERDEDAEDRW